MDTKNTMESQGYFNELINDTTQRDLIDIKKPQSGVPTHTPKRFVEQFHFQNDGTLWVYINNTWRSFTPN
jgi:hypothetical protein